MQTRSTLGSCIVNGRRRSGRFRDATSSASEPSSSPSRSRKSTPPLTPPNEADVRVGGKRKRAKSEGDRDERPRKKQDPKKDVPEQQGEEKEQEEQKDRIVEEFESVLPRVRRRESSSLNGELRGSGELTDDGRV
ncbi:uncharacterized protein SCHCODRAFT_02742505 [Schizophyllum commune H4-8]|nr:uncharacterized protein SCHCODRAFT_02742505 [Schizophyllum commune H4-8]KAI5899414.1 hypothetical protein SCHCODRAFT_02742505 [Schizophyllum commune H4-8]